MAMARAAALLLLTALAAAPALAQRPVTIGVVFYTTPTRQAIGPVPESPVARALVEGLKEKGWVDGRNARLLWRSAAEHPQGVNGVIDELLRVPIDILVASGNDFAAESARRAPRIPVVLAASDFPVETGLVKSNARPGGNITGLTNWVGRGLNIKRMALLKEAAPKVTRIAFMGNKPPPGFGDPFSPQLRQAAASLGVSLTYVPVEKAEQLEPAFEKMVAEGVNGLFVGDYPFAFKREHQARLAELAARHRLPAIHSASTAPAQGALLSFGPDTIENYRRAAYFVDRILRGANPGDIPLEDPAKLELIVNLRAAQAIGLAMPQAILTQASRIID